MFKIRKAEVLAVLVVLGLAAALFATGYMLGDDAALGALHRATDTASESQAITAEAVEAAAMAKDEVVGLRATIAAMEASAAAQALALDGLTEAITAAGYTITTTPEGDTTLTPPATVAPQAFTPAPEPTKATRVAAYKAAQAAITPASAGMTWPTTGFDTKAQCDAHYRDRMAYWLRKYGVYTADYLAHCLSVVWHESKGDCDAYNPAGGYVGLCQYSADWWTTGDDWRTNGDTNLRRLAKALAEGGHANMYQHWAATCGPCT